MCACLLVDISSQPNCSLVFSSSRSNCFNLSVTDSVTDDDHQSLLKVGIEYCMAGASLSATCRMCQAGTYWTGSGEEILFEICLAHNEHWGHLRERALNIISKYERERDGGMQEGRKGERGGGGEVEDSLVPHLFHLLTTN